MHPDSRPIRIRLSWQAICTLALFLALIGPVYAQSDGDRSAPAPYAQAGIAVVSQSVDHTFQGPMTFSLTAESSTAIQSAKLFWRVSGETAAHKVELEFEPATRIDVEHTIDMGDDDNYQPPMVTFTYWWLLTDQAENRLKTEPTPYLYSDTRYDWQLLESEHVQLYWTGQNADFGQRYFDRAVQAAADLSDEFGLETTSPVVIVIYNSHRELMSVLQEGSAEWTGAVNFGDTGMIVIGLGPDSWMGKVIPHELTHAVLHQITLPPFGEIPRWLHEGLAVRSEGGMDFEEHTALQEAIQDNTLISLRVLNSPFPDQRARAVLSYAESNSLVEFIIEEHGAAKLGELLSVFAVGAHYDDAMMEVFGVDMDGMEDQWRVYIGAQPRASALPATATPEPTATEAPTSTPPPAASPTPTATPPAAASPTLQPDATATQEPTATVVAALPQPTATPEPENAPDNEPSSGPGPCLGLLPALALLIIVRLYRPRPVA